MPLNPPGKVVLNGRLVDGSQATVSVFDAAVLHGVGLFETIRAYGGRVFRLNAHLERMRRSAEALKLPLAVDAQPIRASIEQVMAANRLSDARLRVTLTPGATVRPGGGEGPGEPTLLVTGVATAAYPVQYYEQGMTVLISAFRQSAGDPLAGHKTTCYWPRLAALREAHDKGCGESLWFTTDNLLAGGSISNVFIVRDGVLLTPPIGTPVLPGTVRAFILEAATRAGPEAREAPLTINDLLDADEVFLTNSAMEVMPVCRVERKPIGNEKPGPVTAWAAEQYRREAQAGQ